MDVYVKDLSVEGVKDSMRGGERAVKVAKVVVEATRSDAMQWSVRVMRVIMNQSL